MTEAKRNKRVKPDPELVKLADALLVNYQKPEDLIGENGLLKQLTKMLVERALEAEMTEHLAHGNQWCRYQQHRQHPQWPQCQDLAGRFR